MNHRVLAISAIVLVAVIMGMSAVAPMIPQAFASGGGDHPDDCSSGRDKAKERTPPLLPIIPPCPR